MEVPEQYLADLLVLLTPFCKAGGSVPFHEAVRLVGKAERVAQIVPNARPFVGSLWAALIGSHRDWCARHPEQKMERVPTTRFSTAAAWLKALITDGEEALLPLRRVHVE